MSDRYRLTVRHGPRVERQGFERLDDALAVLEERVREVRAGSRLPETTMLRTFEPEDRVAARLEISTGGWLRRRDAGVDVMGDGSLVPYRGGVTRRRLDVGGDRSPFDLVREALTR